MPQETAFTTARNQIVDIGEIARLDFECGQETRLDVRAGSSVVHVNIVPKRSTTRLAVFTNGAVDLAKKSLPSEVFQRRTWAPDIEASCIFLADSTLDIGNDMNLGWGQGTENAYLLPAMSQVVKAISGRLGVDSGRERLYVGSSGGGFQALILGSYDPGSQCLANNPQTDWTKYVSKVAVRRVREECFAGKSLPTIHEEYPERTTVVGSFKATGYMPMIRYLVNSASRPDMSVDLQAILNSLRSDGSMLSMNTMEVMLYHSKAQGHAPLPKAEFVMHINELLGRTVHETATGEFTWNAAAGPTTISSEVL